MCVSLCVVVRRSAFWGGWLNEQKPRTLWAVSDAFAFPLRIVRAQREQRWHDVGLAGWADAVVNASAWGVTN